MLAYNSFVVIIRVLLLCNNKLVICGREKEMQPVVLICCEKWWLLSPLSPSEGAGSCYSSLTFILRQRVIKWQYLQWHSLSLLVLELLVLERRTSPWWAGEKYNWFSLGDVKNNWIIYSDFWYLKKTARILSRLEPLHATISQLKNPAVDRNKAVDVNQINRPDLVQN